MLFKMKLLLCVAAMTAFYAQAQDTGKAGSSQNSASGSQVGKTQTPSETPIATGQNPNRRADSADKSSDAQNRASDSQNRDAQNRNATSEDRNQSNTGEKRTGEDRKRNRRDRDSTTQRSETRERRIGATSDSPLDSQLASCLLLGNQKEVQISQFASERAKNEKVKEFAKQMVKDHTQAISMLQRFAGPDASKDLSSSSIESTRTNRSETTVNRSTTTVDSNRSSPDSERRDSANPANRDANSSNRKSSDTDNDNTARNNRDSADKSPESSARNSTTTDATARSSTNQADRNANQSSDQNKSSVTSVQVRSEQEAMPDKMLAIQREVAQKCLAMAKQELEQSSNFDQAYVGLQISEHVGMIAKLETYKSYASQDLGKVIQESLDTAQGHLKHAKELVMEISHDKSGSSSSSSSSSRTSATSSDTGNRNEASSRDSKSRNPASRDDASPRRDGENKKDAPKS